MTQNVEEFSPLVMQAGFNSAKNGVLSGVITFSGANTHTGVETHTGAETHTGLEVFSGGIDASGGAIKFKRNVLASSGNTTMTSAMSGSIMLLDGAGVDYTLPAIGAGDIGMEFWFAVTVTATDQTITAGAADLLTGGVMCMSTAAGVENDAFSPDVTDDLIITMNGTTQGGIIGSTWHLIAISATRWYCDGTTIGSGTLVTPFS